MRHGCACSKAVILGSPQTAVQSMHRSESMSASKAAHLISTCSHCLAKGQDVSSSVQAAQQFACSTLLSAQSQACGGCRHTDPRVNYIVLTDALHKEVKSTCKACTARSSSRTAWSISDACTSSKAASAFARSRIAFRFIINGSDMRALQNVRHATAGFECDGLNVTTARCNLTWQPRCP